MLQPKYPLYHYEALVTEVTDGDTFKAVVDCGFRIEVNHVFRLSEIDTPEIFRAKSEKELIHGKEAKDFVISKILDETVYIETLKSRAGIYNRWDARVYYLEDGKFVNLADALRENGFEKKESYDD